jgi:hypothetical protein
METNSETQTIPTTIDQLKHLAEQQQRSAQYLYDDLKRHLANFDPEVNDFTATWISQQAVALLKAAERAQALKVAAMTLEGI